MLLEGGIDFFLFVIPIAIFRCLCPGMAMVNHSCEPNCRVYWATPGDRLVLETRRRVRAGEEVTITYCCMSLSTPARQTKLRSSKGFTCGCGRCHDPSEGGTYMGGVKCTKCRGGVVTLHWDQDQWVWKCKCGFVANTEKVKKLTFLLQLSMFLLLGFNFHG